MKVFLTKTRDILVYTIFWRRLDRSTAGYIYTAKNCELLAVLTKAQKTKLIFESYIKTLFNKGLFQTIKYKYIKVFL